MLTSTCQEKSPKKDDINGANKLKEKLFQSNQFLYLKKKKQNRKDN